MSCKELTVIPVQKSLRRKSWEELLQVTATPKVNMGTCLLSEVGEGDSERKQRFLSQIRKLFFSSGKPAPVAAPQQAAPAPEDLPGVQGGKQVPMELRSASPRARRGSSLVQQPLCSPLGSPVPPTHPLKTPPQHWVRAPCADTSS